MHLPDPALTLTIPSIHDGTVLDCRVYHPLSLATALCPPHVGPGHSARTTGRPNAAIVAHPYAPLGGSYDDPIVEDVAGYLLTRDFVVGTFNFRGAGHSAGRTSWTSKPERDDYASFIGFMVHYIHHLDPSPPSPDSSDRHPSILLLAGYSYGAMVTTQLPPLQTLLAPFASPLATSDAAHIRIRAEGLATQQRELLLRTLAGRSGRTSLRVGESGSAGSRKSHESRRSFSLDDAEDKLRRGVQELLHKTRHPRHLSPGPSPRRGPSPVQPPDAGSTLTVQPTLSPIEGLVTPRPAYILVSPLQGIITNLATMSRSSAGDDPAAEVKLRENPTLAVYGNEDVFVSASKLRSWKTRMEVDIASDEGARSGFEGREVNGAGHFWVEEGVLGEMMVCVGEFVWALTRDG